MKNTESKTGKNQLHNEVRFLADLNQIFCKVEEWFNYFS